MQRHPKMEGRHQRSCNIDARNNVGAPKSQSRQRRSPDQYTGYMALMSESVETEPSSFEEAM